MATTTVVGREAGSPCLPDTHRPRRSDRLAALQNKAPSRSSSSLKRTRSDALPSPPGFAPSRTPSVGTTFSAVAQREIINLHGDSCWHCESPDALEFAHVIARGTERIVTHLRSDGKTNLDTLHDTENVMRLCVTCHHALDSAGLPGWVFLPADLDFFFHAEQEDFNRRQRQFRRTGLFPIRQYPPVKDYVEHCGTYDAYMLRAYGAPTSGWRPGPSAFMTTSKAWQGDPMVALFKGFHAFAYEHLLPPKLRDLNLLYRRNDAGPRSPSRTSTAGLNCRADPIPPASRSNRSNRQPGPGDADNSPASATALPGPGHRGRGRGRPPGGRGGGAPNHSPRGNGAALNQGPYTGTRSRKRQLDRWDGAPPPKRLEVGPSPWVWGPHKTANEVGECLSDQKARMRARIPEQRRKELEMENSVGRLPSPENTEVSYEPQTARDLDVEYSRVVQWLSGVTGTE